MCLQPTAKSLHVFISNQPVRLPQVVRAYNILVYLDIWSHQGGTLQNCIVCFSERMSVHTYAFFPSVPFPLSLPSCRDSGTPIGLRSEIKSTQNSMTSSVPYPLEMLPSGLGRLCTYFFKTLMNLSKGNILCRNTGPRMAISSTR